MLTPKLKTLSIGASLLLFLTGCSKENLTDQTNSWDLEGGEISNSEIVLRYGSGSLNQNIIRENKLVGFERLYGNSTRNTGAEYQTPDLSNATAITGNGFVSIDQAGGVYYIPEGEIFSGSLYINQPTTLYVLGTWAGNTGGVPANTLIVVSPTGKINANYFSLNQASTVLNNYGEVVYQDSGMNGKVNNYNRLICSSPYSVTLNSGMIANNHCSWTFESETYINQTLNNYGQVNFNKGLQINSNGILNLDGESLAEINGLFRTGQGGKIANSTNNYARVNFSNTDLNNFGYNMEVTGLVDLNFEENVDIDQVNSRLSLTNGAIVNGNVFIEGSNCVAAQGAPNCNYSELQFTLVASVNSPIEDGITLSATDVKVENGKAYVSYHTNDVWYGDSPVGSLRVFDVSNARNPQLEQEAIFKKAEFNGVEVYNNNLYAVGGNKDGARLITSALYDGQFSITNLEEFQGYKVPSISAKNAFVHNDVLWMASGRTNGGLFNIDLNNGFDVNQNLAHAGAKYVAKNNSHQAFFAISENGVPYLRISSLSGANVQEYTYTDLNLEVIDGKNVIAMDDEFVYIALSDKGVAKIEITSGAIVEHFEPKEVRNNDGSKVFKGNGYTNGLTLNNCYLYLANGTDGVIVLNKDNFQVVGSFQLSDSSNNVYAKDNLLFVATGRSGLNIINIE